MRVLAISLVLFTAIAAAQQNADRVFYFTHNEPVQDMREVGTAIRTITDIRDLSLDPAQRSLTLKGTATQAALADWLFNELEKPANQLPAAQRPGDIPHEFRMPPGDTKESQDDVVQVLYLPQTETIQDFQEVATLIRTTAEIRRVFTYNSPRALVLRGASGQLAMSAFLLGELSGNPESASARHEFQVPGVDPAAGDGVVRVFRVAHAKTTQDFQEVATLIRTTAQIRRVFTYNKPHAMALRASPEQIALAEWMLSILDTASPDAAAQREAKHQYLAPGRSSDVVRIFYLDPALSVQSFQQEAATVRTATHVPIAFTYNAPRALALRGTLDQILQAEQILHDLPPPAR